MSNTAPSRSRGLGRVLILVYGLLALAATGRSVYQLIADFEKAPLAYLLSALAGAIYIVALIALLVPGHTWYRIAVVTISLELVGVLVVGLLSLFDPILFEATTIWSYFGKGYGFVPLVVPILGLVWLYLNRPTGPRARAELVSDAAV